MRARHGEAVPSPVIARRRLPPSLRGGAAAEAIQAGRPASHGREVSCVAPPDSGLLRARFARARNDGGAAGPRVKGGRCHVLPCPILDCFARASRGLAMTGTIVARARNDGGAAVPRVVCGRQGHRPVHRHCEAAQPPKQSRRAGPRILCGRRAVWPCPILDCFALAHARARNEGGRFHRHCEAAKRPKQSRRAGPRILCGRRAVWPCPILDCFALALLALAMTGAAGPRVTGGRCTVGGGCILDCFARASLALAMTVTSPAPHAGRP